LDRLGRGHTRDIYADMVEMQKSLDTKRSFEKGDLVYFCGEPAVILGEAYVASFIGALIEILSYGRVKRVPLGLVTAKRNVEDA